MVASYHSNKTVSGVRVRTQNSSQAAYPLFIGGTGGKELKYRPPVYTSVQDGLYFSTGLPVPPTNRCRRADISPATFELARGPDPTAPLEDPESE